MKPAFLALEFVGDNVMLLGDAFRRLFQRPFEFAETVRQAAFIGVATVPLVMLIGFFSGAVLALYLAQFMVQFGAGEFVGASVGISMTREIGPVISGMMVSARCGSAIAAQLGSMTVNEQVDALRMLSVHPTRYLVIPRIVAGVVMLPVLSVVTTVSGLIGGVLVGQMAGVPSGQYWNSISSFGTTHDLFGGLMKAPVFGLLITLIACRQGLRTTGGAEGVGRAATSAVVLATVFVYVFNFLLAAIIFRL